MARAKIQVNGVDGSNDDLPINTLIQLNNDGNGGETTFAWTVLDQPEGSADALSSTTIQNPTLTPKKEGTYVLQLVVNQATSTESTDVQIVAVRYLKTRDRAPGANEAVQDGAPGWKTAINRLLARLDDQYSSERGVQVWYATGSLVAGQVVYASGEQVIKSGLPGQETVPIGTAISDLSVVATKARIGIVLGDTYGNSSLSSGLFRVLLFGLATGLSLQTGSPTVGTPVFVSDTGQLALTPGKQYRFAGVVLYYLNGVMDVWFDGTTVPTPPPPITFGNQGTPSTPGTTYLDPGFGARTSQGEAPAWMTPYDGVLRALAVNDYSAQSGGTMTITVYKNGVATTLTVALAAGTTSGSDLTDSVAVVQGDKISVQCVLGTGTSSGALQVVASMALVAA